MLDTLSRLRTTALRRLRSHPRYTLAFGGIGGMTGLLSQLPDWYNRIEEYGMDHFLEYLPRDLDGTLSASLFLTLMLRLSMERASDLLHRPVRFLLLLATGAAAATLMAWALHVVISNGSIAGLWSRPDKMFQFWSNAMLWGSLVGWLYLLSLQRLETSAHLAGLLGRRAALGRQLARARLGTARAQVDPAMVARELSEVRIGYRSDAAAASARLDALISHLRRALSRARNDDPSTEREA